MLDSITNLDKLKVLVVDDMLTYRAILSRTLQEFDDVEVTGTASNGKLALEHMGKQQAHLVLMDLEMPVMDGLQTLPELRRLYPTTQVVLISGTNRSSADLTLKALEAGAMDFIQKPAEESYTANMEALRDKLKSVLSACRESYSRKSARQAKVLPIKAELHSLPNSSKMPLKQGQFQIVAIGVSTGGPNALMSFLPHLPGDLGLPVVLVQHMPPLFTASLANSLNQKCSLTVKEAADGETLLPNTVYIAPGGHHLVVRTNPSGIAVAAINNDEPVNSCRPAVDVLFESLPAIYGKNILSIILTGMGQDGAVGVRSIKHHGGYCLTQSEQSCVVYGMPKAVDQQGLSDEHVDLKDMAERVSQLIKK